MFHIALVAQAEPEASPGTELEEWPFYFRLTEFARAGDEAGLAEEVERLAASGDPMVLYGIGRFFANRPTEHVLPRPDDDAAIRFFEHAAIAADRAYGREARRLALRCSYEIARVLLQGSPGSADVERAVSLLLTAAENGYAQASVRLARGYRSGEFGSIDTAAAEHWYRHALSLGEASAALELSDLLASADSSEREQAVNLSRLGLAMLQREAQQGDADSAAALAEAYARHATMAPGPDEVERWLDFAASHDNVRALRTLAQMALAGGVTGAPDPQRAANYLIRAANLGSTEAALDLARSLVSGAHGGLSVDPAIAKQWLDRALAVDEPDAYAIAAELAGQAGDADRQVDLLARASELGSVSAMLDLLQVHMAAGDTQALDALVARLERSVASLPSALVSFARLKLTQDAASPLRDVEGGIQLLNLALAGADAVAPEQRLEAVLLLAEQNARGTLAGATEARAEELLDQARQIARAQGAAGMLALGRVLLDGVGETPTRDEGLRWIEEAAALGDPEAMIALGDILLGGSDAVGDVERAMALYQQAIEAGDRTAHYQIGLAHWTGWGRTIDPKAALEHFVIAAEAGSADAAVELGLAYADGTFVERDPALAYQWLKRAAGAGSARAMVSIANLITMGALPELSQEEAMDWMVRAGNSGDADAQLQLALMLQSGLLGQPDADSALRWLAAAAGNGNFEAQMRLSRIQGHAENADTE